LLTFLTTNTSSTDIYTLSLHDALPISQGDGGDEELRRAPRQPGIRRPEPGREGGRARQQDGRRDRALRECGRARGAARECALDQDRKSTRLNSSHVSISYAVFCLKKKK